MIRMILQQNSLHGLKLNSVIFNVITEISRVSSNTFLCFATWFSHTCQFPRPCYSLHFSFSYVMYSFPHVETQNTPSHVSVLILLFHMIYLQMVVRVSYYIPFPGWVEQGQEIIDH